MSILLVGIIVMFAMLLIIAPSSTLAQTNYTALGQHVWSNQTAMNILENHTKATWTPQDFKNWKAVCSLFMGKSNQSTILSDLVTCT